MLKDLLPKEASCKVKIVTGEEIEISFRPFTLRDLAWNQEEFSSEKDQADLAALKAEPLCKIIWYMMTPESKSRFNEIKFVEYDDKSEKEIERKVIGYEKLLHLFHSQDDMLRAFITYSQLESLNNFIPDIVKKKIAEAAPLIG